MMKGEDFDQMAEDGAGSSSPSHAANLDEHKVNLDGNDKLSSQIPIAVVGMACRLPGHCNSIKDFWDFMIEGKVADTEPPKSRFALGGHYDSSQKPFTMKTPGAMFMEDIDPSDFDARFFNVKHADAVSMDPQQRNLMEVMYECLENAGIPIEHLSGQRVGCFVGSNTADYYDMICRDPEDRTPSPTMGSSRALLSNRINHFLNVHGPSISIDTACSSTLVALDMACLYLQTHQIDAALVGGANMYMSPERNQDMGAMRHTASSTGKCHVFDSKADGYVAAEATNMVFVKRLDDAIKDGDPIRGIILGTSTNSAGKTPGIAMPNPVAQASAIRAAYSKARIPDSELLDTGFLECHGTGTLVGDPIEIKAIASVFAQNRPASQPLIVSSVKSNIGHSEAAAGVSGLIKAVLSVENECIPGTPTFETPNPRIDFTRSRVKAMRNWIKWPTYAKCRASVNSFGFGGSNAHAIVEAPKYMLGDLKPAHKSSYLNTEHLDVDFFSEPDNNSHESAFGRQHSTPMLLVMSANDEGSLKASIQALSSHLVNPAVSVGLSDLAYTLSNRRSRLYHRAYSVQTSDQIDLDSFDLGARHGEAAVVSFVFTGQGAQWPMMGKALIETNALARRTIEQLDAVLAELPEPPPWTLMSMLTVETDPDRLREPEFSQPLVTALQLAYLEVLKDWGIKPAAVIGHSSGEIAATVAAGYLTPDEAIKVAYFRGQAVKSVRTLGGHGMLAAGIGRDTLVPYLDPADDPVHVACFNSPSSITLSGTVSALKRLEGRLNEHGHVTRMLKVNCAYHSEYMMQMAEQYRNMMQGHCRADIEKSNGTSVSWFSSVTGQEWTRPIDANYWYQNMVLQVKFHEAMSALIETRPDINFFIEIGPSNTLTSPIRQIFDQLPQHKNSYVYSSVATRGALTLESLYNTAGKVFAAGGCVDLSRVNGYDSLQERPSILTDLPNYRWNHSQKFWYESLASKDWRYRPFIRHDLLGTKVLGTSWYSPVWKNKLRLGDIPWLKDHKIGDQIVFAGAGYASMAIEAIYQSTFMTLWQGNVPADHSYRLRNIRFLRALVLEESEDTTITLSLNAAGESSSTWRKFDVSTFKDDVWNLHASGEICIEAGASDTKASVEDLAPFKFPVSAKSWYRSMQSEGFHFGTSFQKHIEMEYTAGQRAGRSIVSLEPPSTAWPQSFYPVHPACIDGCMQTVAASVWNGILGNINTVLIASQIDSLIIPFRREQPAQAISKTWSHFGGAGRKDLPRNYVSFCSVFHPDTGASLLEMKGLHYAELKYAEDKTLSRPYTQVVWNVDVGLLTETTVGSVLPDAESPDLEDDRGAAHTFVDMIAHKNPSLSIIEVNLDPEDHSSLWLEENEGRGPTRRAFSWYSYTSLNANSVVVAQDRYSGAPRTDFNVIDLVNMNLGLGRKFDFAIVKAPTHLPINCITAMENIKQLLSEEAIILLIEPGQAPTSNDTGILQAGYTKILRWKSLTLAHMSAPVESSYAQSVYHFKFRNEDSKVLEEALGKKGWDVHCATHADKIADGSRVLITDELEGHIMSTIDKTQWDLVQQLIRQKCHILWVTRGAQMDVTDPTRSLVNGFFRSIRNEEHSLRLINLDVEHSSGSAMVWAIHNCLQKLNTPVGTMEKDYEFVERNGIIHIPRIIPDTLLNKARDEEITGMTAVTKDLRTSDSTIQLRAERVGNLDSLHYNEIKTGQDLAENTVEIEIMAAGVNFKDVAVTIGIVPEDEYLLGGEGSGIITRIGPNVTRFQLGQRVAFFEKGAYGNRIRTKVQAVQAIPDSMSFEEAATIPCVFMTSKYSLMDIAQIKRGDRVLIHSATGGVGIAAIQICRYVGAIVYATVGTNEKREFLHSQFEIPQDHIFSSRTIDFAKKILDSTNGRGVDVILNSLTGKLLDESWRIIADGGTMVEIGKKDILDRAALSMEPFARNASFRALDLSHKNITDETIERLLSEIFELIQKGSLEPIRPIRTFPFSEAATALRTLRSGTHIGKLVLSHNQQADTTVLVRPVPRSYEFRRDACYVLVGGLKGICGTLAVYLAEKGAGHMIIVSRSGSKDGKSQKIANDVRNLGCCLHLFQGDITKLEDVESIFQTTTAPIAGIVQGAMVLRDKTFGLMTVEQYHETVIAKLQGTWNLHQVSVQSGHDLDFFSMLSSISGICGTKGQANYAAANVFLDAFASYRHGMGLRACSIALGAIEGVGYIEDHSDLKKRFDSPTLASIDERILRQIFAFSTQQQSTEPINARSTTQMITGIQIPQPQDSPFLNDARFLGLLLNGGAPGSHERRQDGSADTQALLVMVRSKVKASEIISLTLQILDKYFMQSLRLTEPLDASRPLSTYGIDSLAAVEFQNFVRTELSVEVSTLEVIGATSLESLAEKLIQKISS